MSGNFKITTVGDAGVGKTSLSIRYVKEKYVKIEDSTIGAAFLTKKIKTNKDTVHSVQIWDTAGQERFYSLVPMYLREANAVLFMFDMCDLKTLDNIFETWMPIVNRVVDSNNCIFYIVGNKYDLVPKSLNLKKIVKENLEKNGMDNSNIRYYETSALSGYNVDQLFENLIDDIITLKQHEVDKKIEVVELSSNSTSYCCY